MSYRNPMHGLDAHGDPEHPYDSGPHTPDPEPTPAESAWEPPDTSALRELAQDMANAYGWQALDSRDRIKEWMAGRDLLSPPEAPSARLDRENVDEVESRLRWLLS